MTNTCIITGCAGFIGSHLTEECLSRGWYVYGIDKLAPFCSHPEFIVELEDKYPSQFKFECIDINNIRRIPDVDMILNICAESHVDNSIESCDEFIKSNILGVHHLLELIRVKNKRPLFYQMSTDEIYGDKITGSHVEDDNYNPSNPYSFSKASADLLVKSFHRTYGIEYKIGRATNTWGTRQHSEKLIPKTCQYLQLGKKIPLHNHGTPTRTWLHVKDCVGGILTIVEHGGANEIYNIGGNIESPNWEIVKRIANLFGDTTDYFSKEEGSMWKTNMEKICDFSYHREGQDIRYSLNDNKLRLLGWSNKCDLDKELPIVVNYYKNKFVW
jgi:dTDP-glucose 4,6-dehydratase